MTIPTKTATELTNQANQVNLPSVISLSSRNYPKPLPCHEDGVYLFSVGKARIHAGDYKSPDLKDWDLIINVRGRANNDPVMLTFGGASQICSRFVGMQPDEPERPEIVIDWPDQGVPPIKRKQWRKMVEDLKGFDGDVLVHCMGGHGRTGTLLCILGSLSGAIEGDPVKYLREKYCKKIVESKKQIDYLTKHMNIKTSAEPRPWDKGLGYGTGTQSYIPGVPQTYGRHSGGRDWDHSASNVDAIAEYQKKLDAVRKANPDGFNPVVHETDHVQTVHEAPGQFFKCEECGYTKIRAYMKVYYNDGKGTCYLCHFARSSYGGE